MKTEFDYSESGSSEANGYSFTNTSSEYDMFGYDPFQDLRNSKAFDFWNNKEN